MSIELLSILYKPKKLEQLILILKFNTYACIDHWDLQVFVFLNCWNTNIYLNFSFCCKLESILLEAKKHLH